MAGFLIACKVKSFVNLLNADETFVLSDSLLRKTGEGFSKGNIPRPCLFGQVCGNANLIASIYLYMEAGSTLERFFAHFLCDKESGGHAA